MGKKQRKPETIKNEVYTSIEYQNIDIPWVAATQMTWIRKSWYIWKVNSTGTEAQYLSSFDKLLNTLRPWDCFFDGYADTRLIFSFWDGDYIVLKDMDWFDAIAHSGVLAPDLVWRK